MANIKLLTALLLAITITSTLAWSSGTAEGRARRSAPAKKTGANGSAAKPASGKANKAIQKNSGKAKKVEGKQVHVMPVRVRSNSIPCEGINAKLLDRCCRNPASEFFTEGQLLTSNRQRRNVDLFNSITEYRMNVLHAFRTDNLIDLRNPNIIKRFAEEACLLDTVFKEYQYVDGSGNVDFTVTKNFMLSTSSKLWRPITEKIIDNCQKVITGLQEKNVLNQRATNRKTNETCSIVPYVFVECVRRDLSLSCPEEHFNKNVPFCVRNADALRRCNAFSAAIEVLTAPTYAPITTKSSTTNLYSTSTTTMSSSSSTVESSSSDSTSTTTESSTTTVAAG